MISRRTIVVLFTDLVGSTELLVAGGLETLAGDHLDRQTDAVTSSGGRVIKSEGDGVMATFGSVADAVSAAHIIQQAVDATHGRFGGRIVRVGLSAGDAVERDGDWYGAAVVEAARLCAAADGGQILAAQVIWLLAEVDLRRGWVELGPRRLKGLADETVVYDIPWDRPDERPLGVVVADDSVLLRSGICRLLVERGFRVLGEADDGTGLIDLVEATMPDLVIVDIRMPPTFTLEGVDAALAIRAVHPDIGILVLSQHVESRAAIGLLEQHPRGIGYLLKDRIGDIDDFIEAAQRVAAGGTAIDPDIVETLVARGRPTDPPSALTAREDDVLRLMAEGRSNRAISERLQLSNRTVESHIASIFSKLGLEPEDADHRRVLAVLTYLRNT